MSSRGRHHVTDIWKTHRISANGVLDLNVACQLMPRSGELQDALAGYAFDVLDDSRTAADVVKQMLAFLQFHLSA